MTKTAKFICPLCAKPGQQDGQKSRCVRCGKMVDKMDRSMAEAGITGRIKHWRLDASGEPVLCTMGEWAVNREAGAHILKQEWIGNVRVSTIFLGLDHGFGSAIPILWETMTFSNRKQFDQEQNRCGGGREQAEAMHAAMVKRVKKEQKIK